MTQRVIKIDDRDGRLTPVFVNEREATMAKRKNSKTRSSRQTGTRKTHAKKNKALPGRHPKHPRCPNPDGLSEHALFKRMDAGPVAKTDAWGFCRRRDCPLFGKNQAERKSA